MTSLVWKLFNWLFGSCVFASLSARLDNRSKALEANLGVSVGFHCRGTPIQLQLQAPETPNRGLCPLF